MKEVISNGHGYKCGDQPPIVICISWCTSSLLYIYYSAKVSQIKKLLGRTFQAKMKCTTKDIFGLYFNHITPKEYKNDFLLQIEIYFHQTYFLESDMEADREGIKARKCVILPDYNWTDVLYNNTKTRILQHTIRGVIKKGIFMVRLTVRG